MAKKTREMPDAMARELFLYVKAMAPSTNCRIGFYYKENKICAVTRHIWYHSLPVCKEFPAMPVGTP